MKKIRERFARPQNNKQYKDKKLPLQTTNEIGEQIKSLQKSLALLRRDLPTIIQIELIRHFGTRNRSHKDELIRNRERRF